MDKKENLKEKLNDEEVINTRKKYQKFILLIVLTILIIPALILACFIYKNIYVYIVAGLCSTFFAVIDFIYYIQIDNSVYDYAIKHVSEDLNMFFLNQKVDNEDEILDIEEKYSEELYSMEKLALYYEHVESKNLKFLSKYLLNNSEEITLLYDESIGYTIRSSPYSVTNYYFFKKTNKKINTFINVRPRSVKYINNDIAKKLEEYNSEEKDIILDELDKKQIEKISEISKKYDSTFEIYIKNGNAVIIMHFDNLTPLRIKSAINQNYDIVNAIKEILECL